MTTFALAIGISIGGTAFAAKNRPPNILFVLTDDQGWPTLSSYGNQLVATPHLDRLASDGVRFTEAYASPQCTPSRAMLMTGQHTARNGMWHVIPGYGFPWARMREPRFVENLPRSTPTLPKALRSAGYVTGIAGKWHLTTNADGDYVKLEAQAAAYYGFEYAAPPGPGSQNQGDKHVAYLTDQAVAFFTRHREQPWFFFLSHHTIHGKVSAPAELVAKYRRAGAPESGLHNATYLAAIEHLDLEIGRLLAALDREGQRDRTIVVFMSDNGGVFRQWDPEPSRTGPGAIVPLVELAYEFSNAPLRAGKGSLYEGGVRVPCIVRWPGMIAPGRVESTPIHILDWKPTLLAAAGVTARAEYALDGIDLTPLLRGGTVAPRPLYQYAPLYDMSWGATPAASIRVGDWKLIESFGDWFDNNGRYHEGARIELYNLREDPGEARDRAVESRSHARALQDRLHAWIRSTGAEIPMPNPEFDRARALKRVGRPAGGFGPSRTERERSKSAISERQGVSAPP